MTGETPSMAAGLTRATTDIAFEPERYFPRFAAGAQERRGKFCSSGGQCLSITAERRRDLIDRGRKRRFVHRNELAAADDGTPTDQHCFDGTSRLRKHDLPCRTIEWDECRLLKIEDHQVCDHPGFDRTDCAS